MASSYSERFLLARFEPAYLALLRSGELRARAAAGLATLGDCCTCPRACHADRLAGQKSVCGAGQFARVASASAHFGEEACLSGARGSGTIFFSLCNLRCVFCQNADISQRPSGTELSAAAIAGIMLALQERGCHNINLVTPEHVVPQVLEAIAIAAEGGLRLPIVYNTSAYDSLASLQLLNGVVDVYMPDFKFWEEASALRYSRARDYPARAREAIAEMHRQVGPLRFGPDGTARRGVLVRHLVMPGLVEESAAIFRWLASEVSPDTFVNVMAQYRPAHRVGAPDARGRPLYPEIGRSPTAAELTAARDAARRAGLWRFAED